MSNLGHPKTPASAPSTLHSDAHPCFMPIDPCLCREEERGSGRALILINTGLSPKDSGEAETKEGGLLNSPEYYSGRSNQLMGLDANEVCGGSRE